MAKHELLKFVSEQRHVHAKDVAENWELSEAGARASLHHLRRAGLLRQVWVLTDQGTARLHHFDAHGCESAECSLCHHRQAMVHFVKLPDLSGLQKTGLDDWLLRGGRLWQEEFNSLERIPLNDPTLFPLVKWHQDWKAKQASLEAVRTGDAEKAEVHTLGGVTRLEWPAYHVASGGGVAD